MSYSECRERAVRDGQSRLSDRNRILPGDESLESGKKRHWNKSAEMFGRMPIVGKDSDYIKGVLRFYGGDITGASILDIGCGTGIWSLGLASDAERIVGLDVSESMVECAVHNCEAAGIRNAEFVVADWKDMVPGEGILSERFDIVLIHMTPALRDMKDLDKVLDVCKGCCFYTTGVSRKSNVRDRLDSLCPGRMPQPRNFLYRIMDRLLDDGIKPELFYDRSNYSMKYTLNGIVDLYRDMYRELTVNQMKESLRPLVSRGKITHEIELECVTLCWKVEDGRRASDGSRRQRPKNSQDRGSSHKGLPEAEVRPPVPRNHGFRSLQGSRSV
jgi:SAM-dependent methyltransferase